MDDVMRESGMVWEALVQRIQNYRGLFLPRERRVGFRRGLDE